MKTKKINKLLKDAKEVRDNLRTLTTYEVKVECWNCNYKGKARIPKGVRIEDSLTILCPVCKCNTLDVPNGNREARMLWNKHNLWGW